MLDKVKIRYCTKQ